MDWREEALSASPYATSKHYLVHQHAIVHFLTQHGLKHKIDGDEIKLNYCPLCDKPHRHQLSNMFTLCINRTSGLYHCFRCSKSGNWFKFKKMFLAYQYGSEQIDQLFEDVDDQPPAPSAPSPAATLFDQMRQGPSISSARASNY